ncbi:MAG TPA: IPT/TIG domain-containing protein [Ohtaekwangia sp.]
MNKPSSRLIYRGVTSVFLLIILSSLFSRCINDEPVGITSIYPSIGCRGNTLSIMGWGFGDIGDNNQVKVNGIETAIVQCIPNKIVVTLPDTVTSGKITIQVGNKIITGPDYSITDPRYFVKFKADGQSKSFFECDPEKYGYDDGCTLGFIHEAMIEICEYNGSVVTAPVIESWKGHTFSFTDNHPVRFHFSQKDTIHYSSIHANSQTGSELTIDEVVPDLTVIASDVYIVSGTFKCQVAASSEDNLMITDGEFSIRLEAAP